MVSATIEFVTEGGVRVERESFPSNYATAIDNTLDRVNSQRGAVLSSNYEYPGRYTRWDTAIVNPPFGIEAQGRDVKLIAYNNRGRIFLEPLLSLMQAHEHVATATLNDDTVTLRVIERGGVVSEEERSRAPTVFSVVRSIVDLFRSDEDPNLGLFGAFGYDLAFQFDDLEFKMDRGDSQRDLVLFLPDEILVVDHHQAIAWHDKYEFTIDNVSTRGIEREVIEEPFQQSDVVPPKGDHVPGEYAAMVEKAKEKFIRGDLFEVVPGQMFYEQCKTQPAEISRKLKSINPSPYSFFINLGDQEYLVGASPEMFVRVSGRRIETCPISGTIKRGRDAIEDSEQILKLLNSKKDESELTMCSDVDRNDKSRVCEPGSVKVIGRRQIEMYSKLIHTVDHIEGRLREGPRAWYGGAVGVVHFNGDMNTGLTLRTVRIKDGIAEVRAGATLLFDSDPMEEERETELKASAMLTAIREAGKTNDADNARDTAQVGKGRKILLVDHEDSFVHTLANYFRQTGAEVVTVRSPIADDTLEIHKPDLVVLSPGPGSPKDFDCAATIKKVRDNKLPIFGVCLGLHFLVLMMKSRLAAIILSMLILKNYQTSLLLLPSLRMAL